MKNSRRGFSFIEVLLVLIIAGLLAAVFIPAAVKIRQDVRLEYIEENFDKIEHSRWLYTVATRAEEKFVLLR